MFWYELNVGLEWKVKVKIDDTFIKRHFYYIFIFSAPVHNLF